MNILEIKDVTYNYSNSREKVLSSVNQKFELGQFYAIIGKSGAGKSTLLSLLAGLDKPQKGQILFKNEDIENKGYSNHRKNNRHQKNRRIYRSNDPYIIRQHIYNRRQQQSTNWPSQQ